MNDENNMRMKNYLKYTLKLELLEVVVIEG